METLEVLRLLGDVVVVQLLRRLDYGVLVGLERVHLEAIELNLNVVQVLVDVFFARFIASVVRRYRVQRMTVAPAVGTSSLLKPCIRSLVWTTLAIRRELILHRFGSWSSPVWLPKVLDVACLRLRVGTGLSPLVSG